MEIVKLAENDAGSYWDVEPYRQALPDIVSRLPSGAEMFAADPDHYDYYSERCPKDLKLVALDYLDDGEELTVVVSFRFNDLQVADELSIRYSGVAELTIVPGDHNPAGPTRLGDLAVDEVLPNPTGASHELIFMAVESGLCAGIFRPNGVRPRCRLRTSPTNMLGMSQRRVWTAAETD